MCGVGVLRGQYMCVLLVFWGGVMWQMYVVL